MAAHRDLSISTSFQMCGIFTICSQCVLCFLEITYMIGMFNHKLFHKFIVPILNRYRQTSNISGTEYQNLNISRLVLQSSLPNPLKPGVKLRMKMNLEQRRQAMLQLHLNDEQCYCPLRYVLYYRGSTVTISNVYVIFENLAFR